MVIGGGDTGTDCAGTCLRQGCQSLLQVEILPRPPLERAPDNPWPEWPKIHRVEYGQEEAAAAFGADPRVFLTTARKFVGGEDGQVKQVLLVEVQWQKDPIGRWTPKEVQGTERLVPAQLVLLALGFVGPEQPLLAQLGVERDPRSNVKAEYGKFLTSARGVFAAGDCRRGQSLVVWAINEGRAAARECDRFLMGASRLP
jgi:glutamate synthase (NADPH/NADH) small chain